MNNKHVFCTLFNHLYIDKGLVLYRSLRKVTTTIPLYVLCMDDLCYEILVKLNYPSLIPIKLSVFENDDLLAVKNNRSLGEYCWTCSSSLIKYILENNEIETCTYVDADMYFYYDPIVLINEMQAKSASVLVTGHRYNKAQRYLADIAGEFCVEFNTFSKTKDSMTLLDKWIKQCLDSVERKNDGIHYGDQKYLDPWVKENSFVIETKHIGAGVASWNLNRYKLVEEREYSLMLKHEGVVAPLVFYHFENVQYLTDNEVYPNLKYALFYDEKLVRRLYVNYLQEIRDVKKILKNNFGLDIILKAHPIGSDHKENSKIAILLRILSSKDSLYRFLIKKFRGYRTIKF